MINKNNNYRRTSSVWTSFNDLLNHLAVGVRLLQFGGSDPDLAISRDVFTCFVENLSCIVVRLEACERKPKLSPIDYDQNINIPELFQSAYYSLP